MPIKDKHTSIVLEPSIPFHTLVKLVDAEDIANGRTRTHDLTLELNNITNQLQSQTIKQQPEQLMFTKRKYPNNRTKPAYKKIGPIVMRPITHKKHRDIDDGKEAYTRSKSP